MTTKEALRLHRLLTQLAGFGLSEGETLALLRIEKTLNCWSAAECNGEIQRDDDGTPFRYYGRN